MCNVAAVTYDMHWLVFYRCTIGFSKEKVRSYYAELRILHICICIAVGNKHVGCLEVENQRHKISLIHQESSIAQMTC